MIRHNYQIPKDGASKQATLSRLPDQSRNSCEKDRGEDPSKQNLTPEVRAKSACLSEGRVRPPLLLLVEINDGKKHVKGIQQR